MATDDDQQAAHAEYGTEGGEEVARDDGLQGDVDPTEEEGMSQAEDPNVHDDS